MRNNLILASTMIFFFLFSLVQKINGQSMEVKKAVAFDISIPLRDMQPKVFKHHFWDKWKKGEQEREVPNKFRPVSPEIVPDAAVQKNYNNGPKAPMSSPIQNFAGLTNGSNPGGRVTPPDPAGDVGPNHYVEVVNSMLQVFSKTGTSLYGPVTTSTLWSGFSGNWTGHNDGDAVVLYDENADRWLVAQFAIDCSGSPYTEYELVAISTTPNPTGSWYRYAFQFDYMPDYPKIGVWSDGYYLSVNRFNSNSGGSFVGVGAAVMERSKMLVGDAAASMIYFKTETLGGSGSSAGSSCWAMLPSDCDGTFPAVGTPNYFAYIPSTSASQLRLWALHVDWTIPGNSTFTYVTALPVASYTALSNVSQNGTTNKLDGLGDRLMYRNQYRNFGTYESFVTCHNVSVSSTAAIRWYEYRKTGSAFSLYQQSTYAPGDGISRWMASIAQNANGDIGMAYSGSSSTMYPSIYYTGRKSTDALNTMTVAEGTIQIGAASMTGATRWGDYSATNVDPTDNLTFWSNEEFVGTYGGSWPWSTKIASFRFSSPPLVNILAATAITTTNATLNGTVNPQGLATTYHFDWGTTTSYGNSTPVTSAGSGTTDVAESAGITGLSPGTLYHYRLVGVNGDGTTNGSDLSFTTCSSIIGSSSVSISASANPVCAGTTVTFTPTPDNGGTPTYQWYKNGVAVATGSSYAYIPVDGDMVYVVMTSTLTCITGNPATSNTLTMTVNPVFPVSVTIAASANPVCAGTSVTFTPTPVNGGTPSYQWMRNSQPVSTATTYSFTPVNGEQVYVKLTSSLTCKSGSPANSNTISMTVNPSPAVSVSIAASANPVCAGTTVTFTPTPVNGGTPTYQWYKNNIAVSTSSTYAYIPVTGDKVYVVMTSSLTCKSGSPATSSTITMTVNPVLAASVSIVASANPACAGNTVTFTPTPVNGGSPTFQWFKNSVLVSSTSTYSYAPSDGDQVYVVMTSSLTCKSGSPATSGTVTMSVNPVLAASVSISASANPVLAGTTVTFTPTPVNGGTPTYQWYKNSVAVSTGTTYAYVPTDGDQVYVVMTSTLNCKSGSPATSNSVTMTVNPSSINVNLTLFLEGLYAGSGTMNSAQDNSGSHWGASVADKINVELHSSSSYATIIYTASNVSLSTNGTASFIVPGTYNGSYFITIKHRNSLETVSASAISFASGTVNYNFSDLATRAYGSNLLKMIDNRWVVYAGDVNQDGTIDQADIDLVSSDAAGFNSSYLVTDINGDGIIDANDFIIVDNNAATFVSVAHP